MIDRNTKTFVLDTNVLLHNPGSLFSFSDNHVVIPMTVLEELDKFKTSNNELGRNSREVARQLDALRVSETGLREGVETEQGGIIQVVLRYDELEEMLPGVADNRILGCAHLLKREGHTVTFISKDINARIKADALGMRSEDFENQKINFDELYVGWQKLAPDPDIAADILEEGGLVPESGDFYANEFASMENPDNPDDPLLLRYHQEDQRLELLESDGSAPYGITPRNFQQRMAIELLLDDSVRLVTLVGQAGTGKTLLALAAGMNQVLRDEAYDRLLVSRPIMPLGKDIGYLPGSKDDKLTHWMGPIFDNLHFILKQEEEDHVDDVIKTLINDDIISLEALTYIRGRSISGHYLIVDEAQNLTPHEVKTIISRAGEDTKIVLTGDPYQIDNPYLDANSNGLTYLVERMRGQDLAGHITLQQAERSALAGLAANLL